MTLQVSWSFPHEPGSTLSKHKRSVPIEELNNEEKLGMTIVSTNNKNDKRDVPDMTFPETETFDISDSRSIKTDRNPNAHVAFEIKHKFDDKLTLGPDMIFTEEKDIDVNQGRLIASREVVVNELVDAQTTIEERISSHRGICLEMRKEFKETFNKKKFMLYKIEGKTSVYEPHHVSKKFCETNNMDLPEIKSEADKLEMIQLFKDHMITDSHAGVEMVGALKTLNFMSGNGRHQEVNDEILRVTPYCKALHGKNWAYYNPHASYYYKYDERNHVMNLCGENQEDGKYHPKYIVCMKRVNDFDPLRIDKEYDFCMGRNLELRRTATEVRGSVEMITDVMSATKIKEAKRRSVLNSMVSPHSPAHEIAMGETFNNVAQRFIILSTTAGIGLGTFTAISQLINMAIGGLGLSTALQNSVKVRSLDINMQQVAEDFNRTVMQINDRTFAISKKEYFQRSEQAYYDRITRDFSNLRDNLLSHESLLNSVINREANLQLLNDTDIEMLENELRKDRDVYLSRKHHTFDTFPIIENGTLRIAISIPLLEPSKEAKLYSITKIPTFVEGIKFVSDCPETHLVVYKGSSDWNSISIDEALQCMSPKSRCEIRKARVSARVHNCASAQFFLKKHQVTLKQESDNIPFVQSVNDTILLSLPHNETTLEFHCDHMDYAGADRVIKTNGKSMIHNPFLCDYTVPEYGLSYSPVKDPINHQLPSFQGRFSITHQAMVLPAEADQPIYQYSYLRPLTPVTNGPPPSVLSIMWTPFKVILSSILVVTLIGLILVSVALCLVYHKVNLPWRIPYNFGGNDPVVLRSFRVRDSSDESSSSFEMVGQDEINAANVAADQSNTMRVNSTTGTIPANGRTINSPTPTHTYSNADRLKPRGAKRKAENN